MKVKVGDILRAYKGNPNLIIATRGAYMRGRTLCFEGYDIKYDGRFYDDWVCDKFENIGHVKNPNIVKLLL